MQGGCEAPHDDAFRQRLRRGKLGRIIAVEEYEANRIADLERHQGDAWRPFYLVDIRYKPFEAAATWEPLPSGLIGPVRLLPLAAAAAAR